MTTLSISPYRETAIEYMSAGWEPFPIPLGAKFPPPKGLTGKERVEEYDEYTATTEWFSLDSNVAVRMPIGIIGIDVDGADGVETLRNLTQTLGELPTSFAVTSRDNPLYEGYTAYFQLPAGAEPQLSGLGKNIDIIRTTHRYSVVAPSQHPSGRSYRWIDEQGNELFDIPNVFDAPQLPEKWTAYICPPKENEETHSEKTKALKVPLYELDAELSQGKMCGSMWSFSRKDWFKDTNSRHDATLKKIMIVVSMGMSKHKGLDDALEVVRSRWRASFLQEERERRNVNYEFDSMVEWAKANCKPLRTACYCKKRKKKIGFPF